MTPTSQEDIELDKVWRELFGGPLPVLGAPDIARSIIARHSAEYATDPTTSPKPPT